MLFCVLLLHEIIFPWMFQASPIDINGRQAVVEEKRSTSRGKLDFVGKFLSFKTFLGGGGYVWLLGKLWFFF